MSIIAAGGAHRGSVRGFYPKVINGSLRFNDDDQARLSWYPATDGNRKVWTLSCWVKRSEISNATNVIFGTQSEGDQLYFGDSRIFWFNNGSSSSYLSTSALFRDPSSWYHIVLAYDTDTQTGSNKVKVWVNGTQYAFDNNTTMPSDDFQGWVNDSTKEHYIGMGHSGTGSTFDGYLANVHFIDGQALTASDFGETKNGVWVAKDYAGTFGTNGFYLTFEDDTEVEAFNTVLWKGSSPQSQSITGVGFAPDLVWIKARAQNYNHLLIDTVRGQGKDLNSNTTSAETSSSTELISFDSDGFTVGSGGSANDGGSTSTFVAWCWDAGSNNAVTGHSSVTYTGNSGTQRISGFPFRPDLIWIKARNTASFYHHISDSVRGFDKYLFPNVTLAEETNTTRVISTTDDGMILGNKNDTNTAYNYVAWAWDAGDGDPVSNTDGSITSTVKASQANGFSIVSWTGSGSTTTVGHGLSSAPDFIIIKNRTDAEVWRVYHASLGATVGLQLNATSNDVDNTNTGIFNDTEPTSSVFTVNTFNSANGTSDNMIAYCFHDVTGKQKFGTYSGTGSSGNTVTTGFRPGWVMVKRTDTAEEWVVYDSSRSPFNPNQLTLNPNRSDAEGSYSHLQVQFDSNGFTLLSTDSWLNASGGTYIYAAFAGSYSDYITDYNTDGSIDSRVKANDTTGFSIVSYKGNGANGATVGHGLSDAPDFVITKTRTQAENWNVQHVDSQRLNLNTNGAQVNNYLMTFNASTVTLTDLTYQNGNGYDMIMYAWKETTGYSKFGSYTGNGSATGPTITTGFKPAVVINKKISGASDWWIQDNTRTVANGNENTLFANGSFAEWTDASGGGFAVDFLDNGFQLKDTNTVFNTNGDTYIYAAFADTREAAFWLDQSGNDNDWQPVNLDHNDTVADSPTNNFATLNSACNIGSAVLSDGNLKVTFDASTQAHVTSTFAVTSGKWYAEFTFNTVSGPAFTITEEQAAGNASSYANLDKSFEIIASIGKYRFNGGSTVTHGAPLADGDTMMVAFDADNEIVYWGKNGLWAEGDGTSDATTLAGASGIDISGENFSQYIFGLQDASGAANGVVTANFGQQPFKYDPPA